jgi:hypothetical protein
MTFLWVMLGVAFTTVALTTAIFLAVAAASGLFDRGFRAGIRDLLMRKK